MSNRLPVLATNNIGAYIKNALSISSLSAEEEIELFRKFQEENCKESGRKIILANLKLVVNLAYKFRNFRDTADLIQEGNTGLMTAFKRFDLEKGVRFTTYATWWIKAKIQEFIISQMSIVRFGKTKDERKLFFNLVSTIKDIQGYEAGRELSTEELVSEIAKRLSLSPSMVRESMKVLTSSTDVSIESPYGSEENSRALVLYQDRDDSETQLIETDLDTKMKRALQDAMEELNDREQFIIQNRFLTEEPMTLEEIGALYSVSKERIRQIEARTISKLRDKVSDLV